MKTAVFSDVHGNPTALRTALGQIKGKKADLTVFLGDTELLVSHSRKKAFVETLHTYFTQKRA